MRVGVRVGLCVWVVRDDGCESVWKEVEEEGIGGACVRLCLFVVRAVAIEVEERGLDEPSEERPERAPRHSYSESHGDLKGAAEVEEEQEDGGGGDDHFVLTSERLALFPRGRLLLVSRLDGEFEVVVPGAKVRRVNDQCQVGCHVLVVNVRMCVSVCIFSVKGLSCFSLLVCVSQGPPPPPPSLDVPCGVVQEDAERVVVVGLVGLVLVTEEETRRSIPSVEEATGVLLPERPLEGEEQILRGVSG